jgi:NADH-quinone oxidoreductase subunit M
MHGLARPMPRFATLLTLCVMAAVSLPPFALFLAHVEMSLQPSPMLSLGLTVVLLTWFLASWYMFRMMQRLLFGHHRAEIRYSDLRTSEVAYFVILLAILVLLGAPPPRWLESDLFNNTHRAAMESILWHR